MAPRYLRLAGSPPDDGKPEGDAAAAYDDEHPQIRSAATDPAELAWHLYRHHGVDLTGLADSEAGNLWELHDAHHEDE